MLMDPFLVLPVCDLLIVHRKLVEIIRGLWTRRKTLDFEGTNIKETLLSKFIDRERTSVPKHKKKEETEKLVVSHK